MQEALIGCEKMDSKYQAIKSPQAFKITFGNMTIKRKSPTPSPTTTIVKKIKKLNIPNQGALYGGSHLNPKALVFDTVSSLPVYQVRNQLIKHLERLPTVIVVGETGSGKTTQIPQLLFQHDFANYGVIGITQPRRVAALTVAKRVASEMNCNMGAPVGYKVRFEDCTNENTKIKFMTDGILLREALADKLLMNYSAIILDEAHERTISTDILFGIVKEAQKTRQLRNFPLLRIVVMSATMDVDRFSDYFDGCEVLYLEGRSYNIKNMHVKVSQVDYLSACLGIVLDLHQTTPENHDFLVFLTGQDEIEAMASTLKSINSTLTGIRMRVLPLYASLSYNKQMEVFQPVAPNTRKIILSTNIAETSITIKGIKYVIDSGMVKMKLHDPVTGIDTLKVVRISKAQALQRAGRAGRESDGFCYRAYTVRDYDSLDETTQPEISRCNLASVALQLLNLNIDVTKFNFIDVPPKQAQLSALKQLYTLDAVDDLQAPVLTALGQKMCQFPLDPQYSRMLLLAPKYGCLEEMVNIISVLSTENIFFFPHDKKDLAREKHAKFEAKQGDHITLLRLFRAFLQTDNPKSWCRENFLNVRHLQYAQSVRDQLMQICNRLHLPASTCGADTDPVRRCLLAGLFNNVAELHSDHHYSIVTSRTRVKIHPSSVFCDKEKPKFIVFSELIATARTYVRTITAVEQEWITEMIGSKVKVFGL